MFSKKAQSEIITTVLIILLVLAAVVIVWQVVQNTVTKGGEAVTAGTACIGLNIKIDSAYNNTANTATIKYTRGADNLGTMKSIKPIIVNSTGETVCGAADDTANVAGSLDQKTITGLSCTSGFSFTKGLTYTARLAPKIGDTQCDILAQKDFTA